AQAPPDARASAEDGASLVREYVAFLEDVVRPRGRFAGIRLALDCANGAASEIAPEVFSHHGASVRTLGDRPDGRNINLGCGSLHLERLSETVRGEGLDLGIAFDGDADRALATVMTNLWLERRLADEGMRLLRSPVGDKYVLERMVQEDATLGGEQS